MKKVIPVIIAIIVIIAGVTVSVVLIGKQRENDEGSSTVSVSSSEPSYSFTSLVADSDTIVVGTPVKEVGGDNETVYTIQIDRVLKGRNLTGMGYVHTEGFTLDSGETYVFFSKNDEEKYHYIKPGDGTPWIFTVDDEEKLAVYDIFKNKIITDIENADIEYVREIIKAEPESE
jgi:hypothetical protein